jgi:HSP20 family protein
MRIRELVPWRSRERGQLSRSNSGDPFVALQSEMNRLFASFFDGFDSGPFGNTTPGELATMPKVDVSQTAEAVHVTAELPGMKEQDIEVTLAEGHLVIQGEKRAEKEDKDKNYHRIERSYGSFHRSIPLPGEVDDKKVDASFQNGVLTVVLPKVARSEADTAKKIPVRRLN